VSSSDVCVGDVSSLDVFCVGDVSSSDVCVGHVSIFYMFVSEMCLVYVLFVLKMCLV
jgi:hypothetical protein